MQIIIIIVIIDIDVINTIIIVVVVGGAVEIKVEGVVDVILETTIVGVVAVDVDIVVVAGVRSVSTITRGHVCGDGWGGWVVEWGLSGLEVDGLGWIERIGGRIDERVGCIDGRHIDVCRQCSVVVVRKVERVVVEGGVVGG